ncbi:MAG: helix-turn-helix domain-containing protein [Eubacterium sp.]|nr:helix-turn-helix domain-containing protein [Eubacterium sp.]
MKLSISMFIDELREYEPEVHCTSFARQIDTARFYEEGMEEAGNVLYVAEAARTIHNEKDGIVCWTGIDWVYLHTDHIVAVMNHVLQLINRYASFADQCFEALRSGTSLPELLSIFEQSFQVPLFIIDSSQYLIALSSSLENDPRITDFTRIHNSKGNEDSKLLKKFNNKYPETFMNRRAFSLPADIFPTKSYCQNIFINNERVATMIIPLFPGIDTLSGKENLEVFCPIMEEWFIQNRKEDAAYLLTSNLASLLDGNNSAAGDLIRRVNLFGWMPGDEMRVLVATNLSNQMYFDSRLSQRLTAEKDGVYAIPYQKRLVILCNFSLQPKEQIYSLLQFVLEQNYYCAADSFSFHRIEDTKMAYEQALFTLHVRGDLTPGRIYASGDTVLEYFADTIKQHVSLTLTHPIVVQMLEYDKEHKTNYAGTLECFLKNERNHQLTATELYIHRNTLTQRLSKIKSLWNPNLEDAAERLYLYFSFFF